ncbi:MAG: peptidase M56, partial [Clostridia bacterium]|nr:peptidase M56 [Clostridia bacterium]
MNEFALKLLNMSISAGWMALAVILLRLLLRKAPKWLMVLAWGLVGLRLLLPFTIPSPLSLIPSEETVRIESGARGKETVIDSGIPAVDGVLNPALRAGEKDETRTPVSFDEETAEEKTPEESEKAARSEKKENAFPLLGAIWAAGAVVMLLYAAASYLSLRRSVGDAIRTEKGIYRSDGVKSPFILGLFRPRIYLPSSMDGKTAGYVIAHERAHLQRKDHWW